MKFARGELLAALAGVVLGIGVGAIVRLPLIPYVLPDSVANVIGAAAGAALAVIGAAWVADSRERRHRRELGLVVRALCAPLERALSEVIKMSSSKESLDHKLDLLKRKLKKLQTEQVAFEPRLEDMRTVFQTNGAETILGFIRLKQVLKRIALLVEAMKRAEENPQSLDRNFSKIRIMATRAHKRLNDIRNNFDHGLLPE